MDRRDRREALKLLAGGTATAIGASVIQTGTAFADSGSGTCLPQNWPANGGDFIGSVFVTDLGNYPAVIVDTTTTLMSSITCSGAPRAYHFNWAFTSTIAGARMLTHDSAGQGGGVMQQNTWINGERRSVRFTDAISTSALTGVGNIQVVIQVRAFCNGSPKCWRCFTANVTFSWDGTGLTSTGGITTNGSSNCNESTPG